MGLAVREVATGDVLELWSGSHVDRRRGATLNALHERAQNRYQHPLRSAGVLGAERRAHDAGVHSVGRDLIASQSPGEFVAEQDAGELGLVVGTCARVGTLALEGVEVDPALRMVVRGDSDYSRAVGPL